jgi:hypothetical protein
MNPSPNELRSAVSNSVGYFSSPERRHPTRLAIFLQTYVSYAKAPTSILSSTLRHC